MRTRFSFAAVVSAVVLVLTSTATFASPPDVQRANPLHRTRTAVQASPFSGSGNLLYHTGGSVQTGTHKTYAIYWGTSFSSTYKSIINGYFGNVAADSGKTSNVYYSDTQYYQTISGATTHIQYSEQFGGTWNDTALPTSSGCSSTAGGSTKCVSDAQVQSEVQKAITANGWPKGMGAEYFVFLANGISTCYDAADCAFSQFCAYHSNIGSGSSGILYANMPYTGHNLTACGGGNYPNGDAAADATLSVTSHEANETITDPLGNAWYDAAGYENGDKCAWNFGTQLGGSTGAKYNQVIGSGHYELQQEWSNAHSRCVLTGT